MKISTRMIVFVTVSTALFVFAIIFYLVSTAKKLQIETAHHDLQNTAYHYASLIDAELEVPLDAVRTMAQMFENLDNVPVNLRRQVVNDQIEQVLINNKDFVGMYTCWEPNALDGLDNQYINKKNHDSTGRFIPYWFRSNDSILVEQLADYEIDGAGDYYILPRKENNEVVINPYYYKVGGRNVLMISMVAPIHKNNKFAGVVTADISIEKLNQYVSELKLYKSGYAILVANNGIIAAHPDSSFILDSYLNYMRQDKKDAFLYALKNNKSIVYDHLSPVTKKMSRYLCAPIKMGKSNNNWMFVVSVPNETIFSNFNQLNYIAIIAAIISMIIIGLIIWFAARSVETNIRRIVQEVGILIEAGNKGNLSYRADKQKVHRDFHPIISGINEVLDSFKEPLNMASEYIQQISEGSIPKPIEKEYQGDFNTIKINLNTVVEVLNNLTDAMNTMYKEQASGDYEFFMDDTPFKGVYQQVAQGYNQLVKLHVDNILGMLDIISQYGNGNFENSLPNLPGKQILATQVINTVRQNLLSVTTDISLLAEAATKEKFEIRANASMHKGMYHKIVEDINNLMDNIVNKVFWYEQLLDSIPFPLSVTDMDMNWTFINSAASEIMGKKRSEVLGKQCNNWGADICKTKNCGIECLHRDQKTSYFTQPGIDKDFQVDVTYLFNKNGEKIGHVEVVQEISKSKRSADYNSKEIARLSENLKLISKGVFTIDSNIAPADQHTEEENLNFRKIYESLNLAVNSIQALIQDIGSLNKAFAGGNISANVNKDKHTGEYANIIEGINNTMKAIVNPLGQLVQGLATFSKKIDEGDLNYRIVIENQTIPIFSIVLKSINKTFDSIINRLFLTTDYITKMANGEIPEEISDEYKGDFNKIKLSLNSLIKTDKQIIETAKKIAEGDLTVKLEKRSQADELIAAFQNMVAKLSEVVESINDAADNVSSGSVEISNNAGNMAQSANEQAASVEEVSASVEQMQATINQNAENAKETQRISLKAASNIEIGSKAVQTTVEAMREIIEKIQIVTEIADKTDLLAINAAIEAARAGEHGEGFAVVASEVRKLAEMSKEAGKDINKVSKNSLKIAEESGKMLENIVPQIKDTARLVNEISIASEEQNSGINQITMAITQLNNLSQQNAAASEELSTGSEELNSQAYTLREIVSFLKIDKVTKIKPNFQKNISHTLGKKTHNKNQKGFSISLNDTNDNEFDNY